MAVGRPTLRKIRASAETAATVARIDSSSGPSRKSAPHFTAANRRLAASSDLDVPEAHLRSCVLARLDFRSRIGARTYGMNHTRSLRATKGDSEPLRTGLDAGAGRVNRTQPSRAPDSQNR